MCTPPLNASTTQKLKAQGTDSDSYFQAFVNRFAALSSFHRHHALQMRRTSFASQCLKHTDVQRAGGRIGFPLQVFVSSRRIFPMSGSYIRVCNREQVASYLRACSAMHRARLSIGSGEGSIQSQTHPRTTTSLWPNYWRLQCRRSASCELHRNC